jgi:hypothetical protein
MLQIRISKTSHPLVKKISRNLNTLYAKCFKFSFTLHFISVFLVFIFKLKNGILSDK